MVERRHRRHQNSARGSSQCLPLHPAWQLVPETHRDRATTNFLACSGGSGKTCEELLVGQRASNHLSICLHTSLFFRSYMSFQFEPVEESVFWEDYLPAAQSIGVNGNGPKLAVVFMILALVRCYHHSALLRC